MIRACFFPTCLAAAALLCGSELRGFRGITVLPFCPRPACTVFRAWDLSAAGSAIFNLARRHALLRPALLWRALLPGACGREARTAWLASTPDTRELFDNVELIRSGGDPEVRVVLSSTARRESTSRRQRTTGSRRTRYWFQSIVLVIPRRSTGSRRRLPL